MHRMFIIFSLFISILAEVPRVALEFLKSIKKIKNFEGKQFGFLKEKSSIFF